MLSKYITSDYIRAANRLAGKNARQKIVVYVESFEDVFFWSNLLQPLESDRFYFEVMLPSKTSLCKGKKIALANRLGPNMIACVDADYDYMLQGATPTSYEVCNNPYVFHTYVYAIENFQCYAEALHNACVMATLNDRRIFDFTTFLKQYSQTIWPLFVWNVWAYQYGNFKQFSMIDFYRIVRIKEINLYHPENELQALRKRVNAKVNRLQHQFPQGRNTYKPFRDKLQELGITPETAYLFMRGHDLYDGVVLPVAEKVCELLRKEREREIRQLAEHSKQMQNELASYQHAILPVAETIKRHNSYIEAPHYKAIQNRVAQFLEQYDELEKSPTHHLNQHDTTKEHLTNSPLTHTATDRNSAIEGGSAQ